MNLMQCTPDFLNICRYEHQVAAACDFTQIPRPYFNLAYMLEGSGTLREEKASITVEAGDLIFIPAGSRYWGNWEKSKFITCHFLFPSAGPFGDRQYPLQKLRAFPEATQWFDFMSQSYDSAEQQLAVLSTFLHICHKLLPLLRSRSIPTPHPQIRAAVEYINENFHRPLTVDELARLCHMSTSHFYSCFKQAMGITAITYKNQVAIRHAERLLATALSLSIEDISGQLGFESTAYFRRVFHAFNNCSPREYRQREKTEAL